ncbi:hypothetical protein QWV57_14950 [Geobacillus zalihae]|uniref:hypothetical protein n=1 Tax=Geobacillus TaxID=129337 RepID=UPI000763F5B8|nr:MULTISPECIES: hypothetical protein [Geobacillus]AMQ21575.1 hypothetical protein A0V43_12595 [Geobacillus sp. JS12]OQP15356.1 hypothetical protein B1693_13950 [Geobacillus zalihae]QNU26071.1 hypothetical protein IC806_07730 [Geobacillus zalihae]RXS85287.1 hypothetical protein ETR37_14585 [Geobacillus sp. PK12]WKA46943.1 hypothetical protein QWV57_14950 [Geobacillus zalihae]
MKNVVIHQIVTWIFTEDQLRAYWKKQKKNLPFSGLTDRQYMKLAEDMLEHSSHSQLEQHLLGGRWRTKEEAEGAILAEDESRDDRHVEVIDTDAPAEPKRRMLIDRVREIPCPHCSFTFYVREASSERRDWTCPACGSGFHDMTT